MNKYDEIKKFIKKNNGILYAKDISNNNINRHYLRELEQSGYITRVSHGIYALSNKDINEFWLISQRYQKGIFSHNTALYSYGLTDRTPLKIDVTFPSNIRVNNEYLRVHYIKEENHSLGETTLEIAPHTEIKIYNVERTICDIIRDRNKIDPQIFNTALNEYIKRKDKDLLLLYKYAKIFNIDKILVQYMEVLQ